MLGIMVCVRTRKRDGKQGGAYLLRGYRKATFNCVCTAEQEGC